MSKITYIPQRVKSEIKAAQPSQVIIVVVILFVGLVATLYYYETTRSHVDSDINLDFNRQINLTESLLDLRLQQYTNLLSGGVGLFSVEPNVNEGEWLNFYKSYDLQTNYPGVDAVSFSQYVPNQRLQSYMSYMGEQGLTNFSIQPAGSRAAYAPVTYIAYLSKVSLNSLGYDPLSDPVRAQAVTSALDSGKPVMSGKLSLVAAQKGQPAFIIYMPIYIGPDSTLSQRQASIYGFVFVATNVSSLVSNSLSKVQTSGFAFQILDGAKYSNSSLMYQSPAFASYHANQIKSTDVPFKIDDHTWNIKAIINSSFIPSAEWRSPFLALFRGTVITLLLAIIIWYLISNSERRFSHIKRREVELAKDDLLSLASHQLRTPATVVKQYLGILLDDYEGRITADQRRMIKTAYESNERQLEIANQFLNVARIDSGQLRLNTKSLNLNSLLKQIVKEQRAANDNKALKIVSKLSRSTLRVKADPIYLPMLFENLLSNARKYTGAKGKITVSTYVQAKQVVVEVSDTGIGIAKKELDSIFDKFTRLDGGSKTVSNGSGIGLYLAKQIVTLHGGTISVDSTPGLGSTFTVYLPRG